MDDDRTFGKRVMMMVGGFGVWGLGFRVLKKEVKRMECLMYVRGFLMMWVYHTGLRDDPRAFATGGLSARACVADDVGS
jgi:hypothetical protein